ncbi:type II secretion system protein N [Hydrogenophaga atypica]|uniref:Type II secretion system protein N n=1 Tax=Hydrogenophaga atypica TaxID=249409 RepID=A0ABW2QJX7_9BURK
MRASRAPAAPAAPWRVAVVATLLGGLLSLLLFAPTRWLGWALGAASGGRIELTQPQGTLWQGQANLLLTGGPGSRDMAALPDGVRWRLSPTWAAGPALRLNLQLPCCAPGGLQATLRPLAGGFELALSPQQSRWPTALLAGLGTPWNTLQLQGHLRLDSPGLKARWVQGRLQLDGRLQVDALDISSRLSTLAPLGSYRLTLTAPAGQDPQLDLATLAGALQLSGTGQWVGGRLRFNGEAQASEAHEAALSNLLNIVGRRSGRRSLIALG